MGDRKGTHSFLSPSRRIVGYCLKHMSSCATALGEYFPSMADHPPLRSSSSLSFGTVIQPHFNVHKARAINARTARLEASSYLLFTPPSRAMISAGDVMAIAGSS